MTMKMTTMTTKASSFVGTTTTRSTLLVVLILLQLWQPTLSYMLSFLRPMGGAQRRHQHQQQKQQQQQRPSPSFPILPPQQPQPRRILTITTATTTTTGTHLAMAAAKAMESDFASAFPSNTTLSFSERIVQQADDFIRQVRGGLGDQVEAPPELTVLEEAVEAGETNPQLLSKLMYELMVECGLSYDKDPETGIMTPTQFDIPQNLDVPEVKKEFFHLYTYGMQLISLNLLTLDEVKDICQTRMIPRTGLEPAEFDAWLGF